LYSLENHVSAEACALACRISFLQIGFIETLRDVAMCERRRLAVTMFGKKTGIVEKDRNGMIAIAAER
jgi:hypothetical protein